MTYRGEVLAGHRLARPARLAEPRRIVVSQLADAGTVKVFSSGSALDPGPAMYLHSPSDHGRHPTFREIASFNPFDGTSGTRVATTSTTHGANLLVSGVASQSKVASVLKYDFVRPDAQATMLTAKQLGEVYSGNGPRRQFSAATELPSASCRQRTLHSRFCNGAGGNS